MNLIISKASPFAQNLLNFERNTPHCLGKAAIIILTGILHNLPINPAGFTGRQIMKGTKTLRFLSVPPYMPPEPE